MDKETRIEMETFHKILSELVESVRLLQALAAQQSNEIQSLKQPIRDPARVHLAP